MHGNNISLCYFYVYSFFEWIDVRIFQFTNSLNFIQSAIIQRSTWICAALDCVNKGWSQRLILFCVGKAATAAIRWGPTLSSQRVVLIPGTTVEQYIQELDISGRICSFQDLIITNSSGVIGDHGHHFSCRPIHYWHRGPTLSFPEPFSSLFSLSRTIQADSCPVCDMVSEHASQTSFFVVYRFSAEIMTWFDNMSCE